MSNGWSGPYEANEVVYDPSKVDVSRLEDELRRTGTYLRTLDGG